MEKEDLYYKKDIYQIKKYNLIHHQLLEHYKQDFNNLLFRQLVPSFLTIFKFLALAFKPSTQELKVHGNYLVMLEHYIGQQQELDQTKEDFYKQRVKDNYQFISFHDTQLDPVHLQVSTVIYKHY
ncbi:unnamed protein product [Paramecium primaurelia]|uniref:Uncharacterized protein n=1 Tax=Paramecium primaurelia TaxID=5886 RepID=A0A8S1QMZ7_PARPR|nr:unnamed protein product [Paramecium primaurelia]